MTVLSFDTHVLPPATADVLAGLLEELIATHPGLTAFQLAGSYWNPSTQLSDADVDLRRFGEIDRHAGDDRVAASVVLFEYRGRLIELSEWVFGGLARPDLLSLRDAVSLVRAHLLWERGSAIRRAVDSAARRLEDERWRHDRLDAGLARIEQRFAALRAANDSLNSLRVKPSAVTDDGYFKHVYYTMADELSGFVSVVDLRPPSLARKALMEIGDCLAQMQLPRVTERIYEALGCAGFDDAECLRWRGELDALYDGVAAVNPEGLLKRRYHLTAIAAMIERGHGRAAAFPLWRGLDECRAALDFIPPPWLNFPTAARFPSTAAERLEYRELRRRVHDALERLRVRFGFGSDAEIATRIEQGIAAVAELRSHADVLSEHLGIQVASWSAAR